MIERAVHAQGLRRRGGQVVARAAPERAAVDDRHGDGAPVLEQLDERAARQRLVRDAQGRLAQARAAGRAPAVEPGAVQWGCHTRWKTVTSAPTGRRRRRWRRWPDRRGSRAASCDRCGRASTPRRTPRRRRPSRSPPAASRPPRRGAGRRRRRPGWALRRACRARARRRRAGRPGGRAFSRRRTRSAPTGRRRSGRPRPARGPGSGRRPRRRRTGRGWPRAPRQAPSLQHRGRAQVQLGPHPTASG